MPLVNRCKHVWDFDDVTECTRVNYFETSLPLAILSISAISIIGRSLYNYSQLRKRQNSEYKPLLNGDESPYAHHGATENNISGKSDEISKFTAEVKYTHFDISSLPPIKLNGKPHGEVEYIPRSALEKFRVIFEELLILLQISINATKFFTQRTTDSNTTIIINIAFWSWLLIGTTIRVINLNDSYKSILNIIPNLWVNSFVTYLFLWFPSLISFRSATLGHTTKDPFYYYLDFTIVTLLFANLLTSNIGYRLPFIYITDLASTPAPEPVTKLISFITFSWVDPLIWQSYLDTLKMEQVWDLKQEDYSYYVQKAFKKFSENKTWKFSNRLIAFFGNYLAIMAFWAVVETFILFAPTLLLKKILEYVQDRNTTTQNLAWFYVILMFVLKLLASVSSGQALFAGRRVCIRLKSIIIGEIYAKALRRKLSATNKKSEDDEKSEEDNKDGDPQETNKEDGDEESQKTSANLGAIINLMAVDAYKVSEVCAYLHAFVGAACMIVVSIYLLYGLLGWSAMIGAVSIIIVAPLNFKVNSYLGVLQKRMLEITDKRIQKLNETFQAIRIIKFFAWEDKFRDQIYKIRHDELAILKKRSMVWVVAAFLWFITPTIVTFVSFGCYIFIEKKTLTTPVAFTALSLFNLLRNPLDQISDMLSFAIQSKVSLDRVQEFLEEDETTKYEQLTSVKNNGKIGFKDASFSWDSKSDIDFKLKNLSIDFKTRKLNVIIGPTGSGKTSLLMALLGEMELLKGEVYLPGYSAREDLEVDSEGYTESVAYCSQAAWLLNDSIRNNIIFASPFNKARYQKVVEACGLARDFEILKAGDQTEIGEKGIALSGGQKQRVSLARALYSNSRHILLDDCLSAVDSHTALHIYENCISGPLMQNRTVLLVSHNVALTIKSAEFVVIMDNGKVVNQGTPSALLDAGALGDDEMIKSSVLASRTNSTTNLKAELTADPRKADVANALKTKLSDPAEAKSTLVDEEAEELENLKKGKLIEEEAKSDGVVSIEVYKWYLDTFGGWSIIAVLLVVFIGAQLSNMYQSWWVRAWAKNMESHAAAAITSIVEGNVYANAMIRTVSKPLNIFVTKYYTVKEGVQVMKNENESVFYIIIYSLLGIGYAGLSCLRIIMTFLAGIKASSRIFKRVLQRVLRAKLRFYDSTPIGRIMNRFSKDIEAVDQELVPFADGAFGCVVSVFAILCLITFITPGFIFMAVLVVALYYTIAFFYLNGSRELKRYESITRSPIHQHFGETLVGVSTIRAYGVERRFLQENLVKIDDNNKPFFYMWVTNRWLSIRNDLVGSLVILFSGAFVLLSINSIDSGLAGISLSYAIAFNESALWVVRLYANVEMTMNSVERLQEYLDVDEEPAEYVPENEPPADWPSAGKLEVHDVSLRYAPTLPRVIKNVTFDVEPNNKIGIVGRTGAGKSTIITALFRFLDPETGYIKIDDIDITSIGLKNLRQAITIIPQDPTLFTGTVRSNLDPFGTYNDEQIFEALRRVNLISGDEILNGASTVTTTVEEANDENVNKFLNLENEITEGGGNLSQGQRQLMCLARSLLRAPKIMLLDEATASIDYESDSRIQQTIRQEFSQSTILTIAHRLRSIIDYDKILVMDAGEVIEFDHPYNLIKDLNTTFHSMCADSGELEVLVQLAKEAYSKKSKK